MYRALDILLLDLTSDCLCIAWLTLLAEENGFHKGREAVKYVDTVVFVNTLKFVVF